MKARIAAIALAAVMVGGCEERAAEQEPASYESNATANAAESIPEPDDALGASPSDRDVSAQTNLPAKDRRKTR